ncbi:MAG: hypothetical protein PF569_00760 [Candidatus Woesearchaeota archaeon]|jgi:RNase H-fold protein (predicted Holliday junction resolvase)|nr:hypothetical protein [Candidatus Woesearchaeota archaeon]
MSDKNFLETIRIIGELANSKSQEKLSQILEKNILIITNKLHFEKKSENKTKSKEEILTEIQNNTMIILQYHHVRTKSNVTEEQLNKAEGKLAKGCLDFCNLNPNN